MAANSVTAKPFSMASNGYMIPFASKAPHRLSIPSKPLKFQLSHAYSLSLPRQFLRRSFSRVSAIGADRKEEDSPVLLEGQELEGSFDWGGSGGEESDEFVVEPSSEDAKIFVGNLPYDVDSEKLAQIFERAGVVEIAEVIYNRDTDQSRGFGFVTMSTVEEAEKAVEILHRYELGGRYLNVNKASPRGSKPDDDRPPRISEASNKIYVGNLPWSVDDQRLEQLFSEHGKVVSAQVVSDRETGRSRGFGFVVMASESEMNDAIANLDGQNFDGRALRVNVAESRQRRSSGF